MRLTADQHGSGLSCREARRLFDAHLDGELPDIWRTELNAHRLSCAACRHELALLEVAGQVIASDAPAPALSDDFTDRLLACVGSAPFRTLSFPKRARVGRWVWRGLAAAACIGLAVSYLRRPDSRVAGFVEPNPNRPLGAARSAAPAREPSEDRFQAQLERALTGWRRDATSLRKIYEFITPQIIEEMGLDPADGIHEHNRSFEPAAPASRPEPASHGADSEPELEDI